MDAWEAAMNMHALGPFHVMDAEAMRIIRVPGGWLATPKHWEEILEPGPQAVELPGVGGAGLGPPTLVKRKVQVYENTVFIPYNEEFSTKKEVN